MYETRKAREVGRTAMVCVGFVSERPFLVINMRFHSGILSSGESNGNEKEEQKRWKRLPTSATPG